MKTDYQHRWRIYDTEIRTVAFHAGAEEEIRAIYEKAPELIRSVLVILKPGEALPGDDDGE